MRVFISVLFILVGSAVLLSSTIHIAEDERPDAALIMKWGNIAKPFPEEYTPPPSPPSIPETCLVLDTEDPDLLLARFLQQKIQHEVNENDEELNWRRIEQSQPGVWHGDFNIAKFDLYLKTAQVVFARATGAEKLIVNNESHFADPERRGHRGVPIQLREGDNELIISGIDGGFEFAFWSPRTRMVMGTWDVRVEGEHGLQAAPFDLTVFCSGLSLPLFNASDRTAWHLHKHYGHVAPGWEGEIPWPTDWMDWGDAPPFCFSKMGTYLCEIDVDPDWIRKFDKFRVPLQAWASSDTDADRHIYKLDINHETPTFMKPGEVACRTLMRGAGQGLVLIYVTDVSSQERAANLACARYIQQLLWYRVNKAPNVVADNELDKSDAWSRYGDMSLVVIVGNATRCLAWPTLLGDYDPQIFLPEDIASGQDPENGLRLVSSALMPNKISKRHSSRRHGLIHSRSAAGMILASFLDYCDDRRLSARSVSVTLTEGDEGQFQIEQIEN